jgi:hypothetical protein
MNEEKLEQELRDYFRTEMKTIGVCAAAYFIHGGRSLCCGFSNR